jgi:hypothetical protein
MVPTNSRGTIEVLGHGWWYTLRGSPRYFGLPSAADEQSHPHLVIRPLWFVHRRSPPPHGQLARQLDGLSLCGGVVRSKPRRTAAITGRLTCPARTPASASGPHTPAIPPRSSPRLAAPACRVNWTGGHLALGGTRYAVRVSAVPVNECPLKAVVVESLTGRWQTFLHLVECVRQVRPCTKHQRVQDVLRILGNRPPKLFVLESRRTGGRPEYRLLAVPDEPA